MEYNYIVSNTVESYVRHQSQVSRRAFPLWVSAASIFLVIAGTAILTFGFLLLFNAILEMLVPEFSQWIAIIPAVLIAYSLMTNIIMKKANVFFMKFARFELDFEFTSKATISERGVFFDEGDRQTQIAWTAIGGVFQTHNFMVFYCRGLFYNVPLEDVGDSDAQQTLFRSCTIWCKAAQGHKTAKLFI